MLFFFIPRRKGVHFSPLSVWLRFRGLVSGVRKVSRVIPRVTDELIVTGWREACRPEGEKERLRGDKAVILFIGILV